MPFARPTLQTLLDRIQADIESRLQGSDPSLRRSLLHTVGRADAGGIHGLYGYIDWLVDQFFIDKAEAGFLERRASEWGISRLEATYAKGSVTLTGINGVTLAAASEWLGNNGVTYTTDADATLSSGTATVAVTATTAGTAANLDASATLTLSSPVAGIQSTAVVAVGGLAGGAEAETDDALRSRLLTRIQLPPHGGSSDDYVSWALEASPLITRAFCFPNHLGLGTVGVAIMADSLDPPVPDAATIILVQDYIDALRPVCADLTVYAPTPVALDLTIQLAPSTAAVQDAVTAELIDMLQRDATPGGTILLSRINEAISIAAGETDHVLTSPVADVTHSTGEVAILGTITWA